MNFTSIWKREHFDVIGMYQVMRNGVQRFVCNVELIANELASAGR
ncbi:TPA: hypothetical protein ACGPGC_003414 [Enterobacter hormaechei]